VRDALRLCLVWADTAYGSGGRGGSGSDTPPKAAPGGLLCLVIGAAALGRRAWAGAWTELACVTAVGFKPETGGRGRWSLITDTAVPAGLGGIGSRGLSSGTTGRRAGGGSSSWPRDGTVIAVVAPRALREASGLPC
jgi:hypothetical protein